MALANNGRFVWYDHLTRDLPAAIAFYGEVVGWKTQPFRSEGGEYQMWVGGQGPLGGVMALGELAAKGVGPHWMAHVQVEDVDATARLAKARGGRVEHEPTDIPTIGRFAILADPQGATLSVFRPTREAAPHDPTNEGEFRWNELATSDSAAAARFYTELLGWKILQEMDMGPDGKYRIFGVGDLWLGGMFTAPKGSPQRPAWLYYVSTSDLDAAIGRATRKGAKLLNGPMDVPQGQIAQLLDPQGAPFALHEATE